MGGLCPLLSLKPRASSKLPHPGVSGHLTPRYFMELFPRDPRRRLVASACLPQGQVAKKLMSPWPRGSGQACFLPRLLPKSGARGLPYSSPPFSLAARPLSLHWERVILVLPALLLRNPFQSRRPTVPDLLHGQRAAPSTDMLLGTAVKNVSLSLRLFPQAAPRFSLRPRGCRGIEDFAPCGFITPC